MSKSLSATMILMILATSVVPASASLVKSGPIFFVRIYTSEVPSSVASEGQYVRIGVILPADSKVAKVEAFMDDTDFGRSTDKWRSCDFKTGDCELDSARVTGLSRTNSLTEVVITADFWNMHNEMPRFAKLKVTFLPIGNMKKNYARKECWLRVECGFAGWMDSDFKEEAPVKGSDPDD
ncbi:MAG: hypothetical protein ACR2QU_05100 [Gammaproteobacteria bacterium]